MRSPLAPVVVASAFILVSPEAGAGEPASGACSAEFLEFHGQAEARDPKAVETLHRAARCAEAAGQPEVARRADALLVERYPDAAQARPILAAQARGHVTAARFQQGAEAMETFAARYPDDAQTVDLLLEASRLRRDLGDARRAAADLDRAEAILARAAAPRAAEVFWSRRDRLPAAYADDASRRAHAETYLKKYAAVGGPARRLLAAATLGDIAWRASCSRSDGPLGLCVALERAAPGQTLGMCAAPDTTRVRVYGRDRKRVAVAEAHFREVVVGEAGALADPELALAVRAAARAARAALVDRDLEAYLDVHGPKDLAFKVEEWRKDSGDAADRKLYEAQKAQSERSARLFLAFYQDKTRRAQELFKQLDAVVAAREDLPGSIAAAARSALVNLDYADEIQLFEAEPGSKPEVVTAFCEELRARAEPVRDDGVKKLSACLTRATVAGRFDATARHCEEELQRRAPLAFPPLKELFAAGQSLDPEGEAIPVQVQPYDAQSPVGGPAPLPPGAPR